MPIAASAPALALPQATLSDGTVVDFCATDSWSMVGQTISIPEGAWSGDPLDPTRLRYLVVGLSFSEDVPLFVVEVSHGSLAGTRYQVGAKTVKALMTKSMKKILSCPLGSTVLFRACECRYTLHLQTDWKNPTA